MIDERAAVRREFSRRKEAEYARFSKLRDSQLETPHHVRIIVSRIHTYANGTDKLSLGSSRCEVLLDDD